MTAINAGTYLFLRGPIGKLTLRQTDFGITPVSAGGGTVKVKDELGIDYKFVATEKP
jgi:hypothetical protein